MTSTEDLTNKPDALDEQPVEDRVNNRSHRPSSDAFKEFMATNWATDDAELPDQDPAAAFALTRRVQLSALFPDQTLVIPAGNPKVRSNDTDYRFRPHSAFAHMTGLGEDHEPDAVLVLEPVDPGSGDGGSNHQATLFFRPMAGRDSEEFYADARSGEFWIGPRPTLGILAARTGIRTEHLDQLAPALEKSAAQTSVAYLGQLDTLVDSVLSNQERAQDSAQLIEALSELRMIKDDYEIDEMRKSVAATMAGFDDIIAALPRAKAHPRGERVVEGAFFARARLEGNDLGYDTIAAAGNNATILHWIRNTGEVKDGDLLLVDAGIEADSLYTADVTRTIPVSGKFTEVQRKIYHAVLDANDAAFEIVQPGIKFRDIHNRALEVLARRLEEWGLLPVPATEALKDDGQQHRRWMPHGTCHHLGLDVHDCAQARREMYLDGTLAPGMIFTIEPGLYFKKEDLAVPEEYRGIGVRIEDNILVTENGAENLTAAMARTPEQIEAWMAQIAERTGQGQ